MMPVSRHSCEDPYDILNDKEVYSCPSIINTGKQANDTVQIVSFINEQIKAELNRYTPEERQAYEEMVKTASKYMDGVIELASSQGTAMESNTSDKTFQYTLFTINNSSLKIQYTA